MTNDERRIMELLGKIPKGTICDDDNCCGGCLTADEAGELEQLLGDVTDFTFMDDGDDGETD